jgi:hypothetical protein
MACLRYVAGLSPALALNAGGSGSAVLDVLATEPNASFHVKVDTEVAVIGVSSGSESSLSGRAVDLLEALSFRSPMEQDMPAELQWAFAGLSTVYDR